MKIVLMVLAALFLLLLCPVRLQLHWKEELSATARWLFLRFPLLPRSKPKKEQPEKPSAPQKQAQPAEKAAQPGPVDTLTQYADLLPEVLGRLKGFVVFILRHTRVKKLRLDMLVAKEDAAETAIAFGRANQAVYTALGLLQNLLRFGCKPERGSCRSLADGKPCSPVCPAGRRRFCRGAAVGPCHPRKNAKNRLSGL